MLKLKEISLYEKVFEKINIGILRTDADCHILDVNQAFLNITEYSKEELIGKNPSMLQSNWHDKTFYENMWDKILKCGCFDGEIKDRKKSGTLYTGKITIHSIVNEFGAVKNYIAFVQDITMQKNTEKIALFCQLTQLANRFYFEQELQNTILNSMRTNSNFALVYLDLDGFKPINDTYGHLIGDKLLCKVAEILKKNVRKSDFVSRIGGDEFTIILKNIVGKDINKVISKIFNKLSKKILIDNIEITIGASMGIAIYPDDGIDLKTLLQNSDFAMYHSKQNGKNSCTLYCEMKQ
jgi:diguanylate cyclase (GGDEF)-like protein/PAS domain S-box-containing protein